MTAAPHPWRTLGTMPHVRVDWAYLPVGYRGFTNGRDRIWLSRELLQRERRSTLAHELEHIRCGHQGCQPPAVERLVRHHAARWLLPDLRMVVDEVVYWRGDTEAAAEWLWVDRVTVEARLDPLHTHPAEKAIIRQRLEDLHVWAE